MNIRSAKQKGRRLSQLVADTLHKWAPDLRDGDIAVTPASVAGPDVQLSPAAKEIYPYAIECKNVEKIQLWPSYEQACTHVKKDEIPVLVVSKNRSKVLVVLELEHFMKLTR
jgi:hypothetical protein